MFNSDSFFIVSEILKQNMRKLFFGEKPGPRRKTNSFQNNKHGFLIYMSLLRKSAYKGTFKELNGRDKPKKRFLIEIRQDLTLQMKHAFFFLFTN